MSYTNETLLIGKTVTALELSQDRETLTLTCADGSTATGITYGDCCSQTWIENIENEEALIGHAITAVEDIEMPSLGDVGTPHHPDVECVQYYGLRITTTGGICTIDYRNDSNGYYGGDLSWSATSDDSTQEGRG
jgi:hypothetical protein